MSKRRSNLFEIFLLVPIVLVLFSGSLQAQDQSTSDRIYFQKNRYHKKTGWINSLGIYVGNWDELFDFGLPENLSFQFDYLGYKLINPKFGLGGGAALKYSPTPNLGEEVFSHYKFAEVFIYAKRIMNERRGRLFIDAGLGYAHPLSKIRLSCRGCQGEGPLFQRYTSGPTIQAGIGFEGASSNAIRKGIKLSFYQNVTKTQSDLTHWTWVETPDGIIKRSTSWKLLSRFVFGINLYL